MKKRAISATCIAVVLAIVSSEPGYTSWVYDGLAINTAANDQTNPTIVSDGAGGSIITWVDNRTGIADIYAQRVNASGTVQWEAGGVALCTATGDQDLPSIVSDGAGGAIVMWHDSRNGGDDIYAQRVNASGTVEWTTDGIALCPTTLMANLGFARITSDGAGGAIVTWRDYLFPYISDVYAQRVNASGTVQWTVNCTEDGGWNVINPSIVSDDTGGAIVMWEDYSQEVCVYIEAKRLNASGDVEWAKHYDAISSCTSINNTMIASDGAGGAVIAWEDYVSEFSDIYAQRVDASGAVLWTTGGVALCTASGNQAFPMIVSDGAGGAIVTWHDSRGGNNDIYAQRVNVLGAVEWTTNGVALCTASGDQDSPMIVSDGAGGAIVTWHDSRGGNNDIYAQRVNVLGAVEWTTNGVALCTAMGDQRNPAITSDDWGGAIITWQDGRSGNWDIYADQIGGYTTCELSPAVLEFGSILQGDSLDMTTTIKNVGSGEIGGNVSGGGGNFQIVEGQGYYGLMPGDSILVTIRFKPLATGQFTSTIETGCDECQDIHCIGFSLPGDWEWDGIPVCTTPEDNTVPNIAMVQQGEAIIAWLDNRLDKSIFAQKIDIWGRNKWPDNGVVIASNPGSEPSFWNPARPLIVPDQSGGAFIAFDMRISFPDVCSIYVQRISALGAVQWPGLGMELAGSGWTGQTRAVSDGTGGLYVVACGYGSDGHDIDLYLVNGAGELFPDADGLDICTAAKTQYEPDLISDGGGNVIVAWSDNRSWPGTGHDIYVQKAMILESPDMGFVFWTANGVPVCAESGIQDYPKMAEDGSGGAFIIWSDSRDGNSKLYAQRVIGSGVALWGAGGIPVCTLTGWPEYLNGSYHNVVSDGTGGVIIAWDDLRNGDCDIYALRLNGAGAPQWTPNGIPVCAETGNQRYSRIVANGLGEFIITWQDSRNGSSDVYAQKLDLNGAIKWESNGEIISEGPQAQEYPYIASDNYGGAMITWQDTRSGSYDIYAQRICEYVAPIATMLQEYLASISHGFVIVEWKLSSIGENAVFSVLRSEAGNNGIVEMDMTGLRAEGLSYSIVDTEAVPGKTYTYQVKVTDEKDVKILFETEPLSIPEMKLTLLQNHPNPFNPSTTIRYYMPERGAVTLSIFDVTGRLVKRLVDEHQERGPHSITWEGLNDEGAGVASGIYFYRMTVGKETISRKMVLLK